MMLNEQSKNKNFYSFLFLTAFLGYVLPFGQMSLWGNLISLRWLKNKLDKLSKELLIWFIMPLDYKVGNKYKGWKRIGPHDKDIISILFGSLLGDGHAEKRTGGIGTGITFYQEGKHH